MRDSVLNSNTKFDYGAFLSLETKLKRKQQTGDKVPTIFKFQFTHSGTYVFHDSVDKTKLMVVQVMDEREVC